MEYKVTIFGKTSHMSANSSYAELYSSNDSMNDFDLNNSFAFSYFFMNISITVYYDITAYF